MGGGGGGGVGGGVFFFFNDTATTEIYTLSLHDALPILVAPGASVTGDQLGAVVGLPLLGLLALLRHDARREIGRAHV